MGGRVGARCIVTVKIRNQQQCQIVKWKFHIIRTDDVIVNVDHRKCSVCVYLCAALRVVARMAVAFDVK